MSLSEQLKFLILRSIGNFLLLFALFGVGATFGPAIYFEVLFHYDQARGIHYVVADTGSKPTNANSQKIGFDSSKKSNEQVLTPVDANFDVIIPKIGANARVFPNVDPTNENEFLPILQQGVAHTKGTVFPGMNGNIYLFAHSTDNFWDVGRYNAVFYLLKDVTPGDDITVFYQGLRYDYSVAQIKIVDPNDTSYITQSQKYLHVPGRSHEQLVLQTCWPPGTTWKRLLVVAKPK